MGSDSAGAGADPSPDQTPAGWSDYAETYDAWLMPITRRFAAHALDALRVRPGMRLLDVGAGTGALAIAAGHAGAEVLATDFAPGMVELLRRRLDDERIAGARTAVMDGQALEVADGTFDAAASLFGLIFFPDTAAGARELLRVLRPGGRAAVVAWVRGGFAVHSLALEALGRLGLAGSGGGALPAAFRLGDPAVLEALLVDAGFGEVAVHELEHALDIPDPKALFASIPSWSAPLRPVFDRLDPAQLAEAADVFSDLVREQSGEAGLPVRALLAVGRRL